MAESATVSFQIDYWKYIEAGLRITPSTSDAADYCELMVGHRYCSLTFKRKDDGEWPYELQQTLRLLQKAYEQGRADKLVDIQRALGIQ